MPSKFDITVITPVFNGERYIRETVESVLNCMSNKSVEYLIINDGSKDSTGLILGDYENEKNIRILTQDNQGEAAAVNLGIRESKGKILLVVNYDDPLISGEIFEGVIGFFNSNPHCVAWYPNWQIIDALGNVIATRNVQEFTREKLIGEYQCLPGPGTLFRRDAAILIEGRNPSYRYVSDYDFWLRLSTIGNFSKRDQLLAQWRMHPESTSVHSQDLVMFHERLAVISEFVSRFDLGDEVSGKALSHARYYASTLQISNQSLPGKITLWSGIRERPRLVREIGFMKILFIFSLPLSKKILKQSKLVKSWLSKLQDITLRKAKQARKQSRTKLQRRNFSKFQGYRT